MHIAVGYRIVRLVPIKKAYISAGLSTWDGEYGCHNSCPVEVAFESVRYMCYVIGLDIAATTLMLRKWSVSISVQFHKEPDFDNGC